MRYNYYPFTITNIKEISLPITLFENSRFKFELVKLTEEIVKEVFPNHQIIKKNKLAIYPASLKLWRLDKAYKDILSGNIFLQSTKKRKFDGSDALKYSNGINAVLDVIQLFSNITLNDYLTFHEDGSHLASGLQGNYRQSTPFNSKKQLKVDQIELIKAYTKKYIDSDSKKLKVAFELLRNSDINGNNSFPLKCSLLLILIESFFLEGIRSDKENFAFCLEKYFELNRLNDYKKYYRNRGKYFHSGIDEFEAKEWSELIEIVKSIICDFLDDEKGFKRKINIIKKEIKK